MRTRAAILALLAAMPLTACDAVVVVGTDCPPLRGACPVEGAEGAKDAGRDDGGVEATDGEAHEADAAGARDASRPADGSQGEDAEPEPEPEPEVDAGPGIFPEQLQNLSFELSDGGVEGALPALEMPSAIAPWYACRGGLSVVSSARAPLDTVNPQAGDTFVGDSFPIVALNLTGLNQDLSPPLKAGQPYAFKIDLWAEGGLTSVLERDESVLELAVLSGGCYPPLTLLTTSKLLPNGSWQTRCIRFIAKRDVSTLVLMVNAPAEYANLGARLFIDNIRSEPDCQ